MIPRRLKVHGNRKIPEVLDVTEFTVRAYCSKLCKQQDTEMQKMPVFEQFISKFDMEKFCL